MLELQIDDIHERAHTHTFDQSEVVDIRKHFAAKLIGSMFMFYLSLSYVSTKTYLITDWG